MKPIAFFDLEVSARQNKVLDIGAVLPNGAVFHKNNVSNFWQFVETADFICGHNVIAHDLKYLQPYPEKLSKAMVIDTLPLSPLLFPKKPYHRLLKDDKLQTDERNNPVNDALKAKDLFNDQINAFNQLPAAFQQILTGLLCQQKEFAGFFNFLEITDDANTAQTATKIKALFEGQICSNCDLLPFVEQQPVALAYALALLHCNDRFSVTPPWVLKNYPHVERLLLLMRSQPCIPGCGYCNGALDPVAALQRRFTFPAFRKFDDEPLQEMAAVAAVANKSLLAVFPTGGGKSITFQVPALMCGENANALTVIISPLQSLMKDQVDNLERKYSITEAVTINGLLDPVERSKAIERVESGQASLLYIAPELLRSVTIERLLLKRKIARFVIDEAHCFSSWGQDFRVDYLYIGDFIKKLQQLKNSEMPIPVSCFTATAKRKVIEDICGYFKEKLNLQLEVFKADGARKNLHYEVFQKDNDDDKYNQLRGIIENRLGPAIVYVARTARAEKLAQRLNQDGFGARAFHGKMDKETKVSNQEAFMNNEVNVMVATSAFGMGVDKSDVKTVIHYDISDSLENYVQEAGRAGRDEKMKADCCILFSEEDLDKHFILLNQTKIGIREINQVWKAIKDLTGKKNKMSNSALEIARKAGWDDGINDIETRVTTALAALEDAGYLRRGQNSPRVFANSILSKTSQEAIDKINTSHKFTPKQKDKAIRIIKKLFSSKSRRLATEEEAESRIDYISDNLGIVKEEVIRIVELLREEKILAQTKDLTAFIQRGDNTNRSLALTENFIKLEQLLLKQLKETEAVYNLKEINEKALEQGLAYCNIQKLKTILNFWAVKHWIKQRPSGRSDYHIHLQLVIEPAELEQKTATRSLFARTITAYLYRRAGEISNADNTTEALLIEFSVQELMEVLTKEQGLFGPKPTLDDVEDTLFYLSRIEAIKVEGGFLVVYNRLTVERLEENNRIQYKESDYEKLRLFYQQRVQQIHIVGEYAKKMLRNYEEALQFVNDYFELNYNSFLTKYFPGSRHDDINRTLTPEKFRKLFGELSPAQLEIIKDAQNPHIAVAAGPGSGKTKVLAHKLASLLLTEDVKHEQLLMLTFSRAAAAEFKKRLMELIGNAARFIDINTFHAYCFDITGRVGSLQLSAEVVKNAVEKIRNGDIEASRITKTALVIDEAQDMSRDEYELVQVLMQQNEGMRVMLVGDDDQNIYEFRGSSAQYMKQFITEKEAKVYELPENYRSKSNIVAFANQWAAGIHNRLKQTPGMAQQRQNGHIQIVQYQHPQLFIPVAEALSRASLAGSTCLLTQTNEEAVQLTSMLLRQDRPAKLIQSNDGFSLANLYEPRYFTQQLQLEADQAVISSEQWSGATNALFDFAQSSPHLQLCRNLLSSFEQLNPDRKYKSDWNAFLAESAIEDFTHIDTETIYVSTMHKVKGKEFDNVYMMLSGFRPETEEKKRLFYVAATRAKNNLSIHYNGNYIETAGIENLEHLHNNQEYAPPHELTYYLGLKDVYLSYFEYVQHRISHLYSGEPLKFLNGELCNARGEQVLKFSNSFKELMAVKIQQGYQITTARINFIVYWKEPGGDKEVKVILPKVTFKKQG
jgi:ATP-dependent DNA helicase RecQ